MPEEGARRETKEEVGLDVTIDGPARRVRAAGRGHRAGGVPRDERERCGDRRGLRVAWRCAWFAPDEIPWAELAFETTEQALRDWVRSAGASGLARP